MANLMMLCLRAGMALVLVGMLSLSAVQAQGLSAEMETELVQLRQKGLTSRNSYESLR